VHNERTTDLLLSLHELIVQKLHRFVDTTLPIYYIMSLTDELR